MSHTCIFTCSHLPSTFPLSLSLSLNNTEIGAMQAEFKGDLTNSPLAAALLKGNVNIKITGIPRCVRVLIYKVFFWGQMCVYQPLPSRSAPSPSEYMELSSVCVHECGRVYTHANIHMHIHIHTGICMYICT